MGVDRKSDSFARLERIYPNGLAGGYIPNFVNQSGGRFKTTVAQILKGLGKAGVKLLIDQYLGEGVLDSVEQSGLTKMKPADFKFFKEELKKPSKGKHRKAFEKALLQDPAMQAAFPKDYQILLNEIEKYKRDSAAKGFLPNFANPLQAAVGREMAAGVPASQIYIDKSPSLKSAANPMGLMVANRRDEPAGGFQGINRAMREGRDPKMYGAAGGFVPNYASLSSAVSTQTGIKINTGPAQQAIDSFAAQASKASADMEKLTKKLSEKLASITNENVISKQLAETAQKEIIKRKEEIAQKEQSIATKALENESNKKLAKQLDKVYLEYNKSQKTKQDLTNAEAKAAAILQKTQLAPRTQQAIISSTGSLVTNRSSAQVGAASNKDMLGPLFAVQGAMTALTGATNGATEGVGKYANAVADGIASFSTAAFAIQGLGAMGGAIGKFTSSLGPAGLAAAGVFAAFKIGKGIYEEASGANKRAANAALLLANAAENAAYSLDGYSQGGRKDIENVVNSTLKQFNINATEPELKELRDALTKTYQSGASVESVANILKQRTTIVVPSSQGAETTPDPYRTINDGDLESIVRNLVTLQSEKNVTALSKLQDYITQGRDSSIISSLPGLNNLEGGENTAQKINDLSKDETNLRAAIEFLQKASTTSPLSKEEQDKRRALRLPIPVGVPLSKVTASEENKNAVELAELLEKQDVNRTRAIAFLEKLSKYRKDAAQKRGEDTAEAEKSYRVNIGKIKAELALESKLATIRNSAAAFEIGKLELINSLENDRLLTNDERAKKIAEANAGYDISIKALETQEQKIKNIEQALIDSVSGIVGIGQDEIATTVAKIGSNLPTFNVGDIDGYLTSLQVALANSGVIAENHKAIVQALLSAEILNNGLNTQQQEALKAAAAKLGIDLKILDLARDKAILEKSISDEIDSRRSGISYGFELKSLNLSRETLSINQQIEKIKRDTSDTELQAAEKIFALESKRANLEKRGIQIDLDKSLSDLNIQFEDRVFDILKTFGIDQVALPAGTNATSDVGLQNLLTFSQGKLSPDNYSKLKANIDREQKRLSERTALETGKAEIQQGGIYGPETPDIITKSKEGFDGGMKRGIIGLKNQINTFAFDIGEKIPQMFSDNMSNAINKMIEGGESFGNVLQVAAYEFVKGINQANIQNLSKKFSNFLFKPEGGGASGIASIFGFASGGKVTGGSGSKDDVPAMLMGGEYVINKNAVRKYGPQFFDSINKGQLSGFAEGGKVPKQRGPQGNFYTPGTYGTGAIEGKRNLLDFATQSGTSGQFDRIVNMQGYQSISLEPESSRLTVAGMRNSPAFEATQSAKQQAFDLYLQQYQQEKEAKKAEKEAKKAFRNQLIMMAATAALAPIAKAGAAGFKAAFKGAAGQGFGSQLGAGFKGIVSGGNIGGQQVGGLSSLFSSVGKAFTGDFAGASNQFKLSQIGSGSQLANLYKSDPQFASYIDSMGGFDVSGAPRASVDVSGAPRASIVSGAARTGAGVIFNADTSMRGGNLLPDGLFDPNVTPLEENSEFLLLPPKPQGNATGGMIPSTSGIDTVPAMLSGGEFIMNRAAVQNIGAGNLQSMNSGTQSVLTDEASKEMNEKLLSKLDELIEVSSGGGDITINVSGSGNETTAGDNNQDASSVKQQLAREVKDAVLKVLDEQKRLGGRLRR